MQPLCTDSCGVTERDRELAEYWGCGLSCKLSNFSLLNQIEVLCSVWLYNMA